MKTNVIGIDIGGTKTEAVLYDEAGRVLKSVMTGSCHLMNAKEPEILERLAAADLDPEAPAVIGYAGYGRSAEMKQKINTIVKKAFGRQKVYLMSDLELAMYAGLQGRDGTLAILGTGSIVVSVHDGVKVRKGGWGYLLGDEGSGYAIGRALLRRYVREADGREAQDEIFEAVNQFFALENPNELIACVMKDGAVNRGKVASCAKIVTEYADRCESCRKILQRESIRACELIASVAPGGENVTGMGGMMHAQNYIDLINRNAQNAFQLIPSEQPPVYGAYVYGKEKL